MKEFFNKRLLWFAAIVLSAFMSFPEAPMAAREAAFVNPNAGGKSSVGSDAIVVEPRGDIDTGESIVGVARRLTLYFSNQSGMPVEIESLSVNNDGNVENNVVSDDCSREKALAAASRCAVVIDITPSTAGSWTAEVMLTHKGTGRIARAKLSGRSKSQSSVDKRETGFSLSTKDTKPIDFGTIEPGIGRVVRTALMINDSPEDIVLLSIDVIAAENGLERLDQGCVLDMELKPGESCPVTLVWKPETRGLVSTDLIIRHSGKLGFAVIPLRGVAKEDPKAAKDVASSRDVKGKGGSASVPPPALTTAEELEKAVGGAIPPVSSDAVSTASSPGSGARSARFRLIGTVGNRAVLLKPDGETVVAEIGEEVTSSEGSVAKVTKVMAKSVEAYIDGTKTSLTLETASELTSKAAKSGFRSGSKRQSSSRDSLLTGGAGK